MAGPSLADLVDRAGPLPAAAVWRLAGGLIEALQAIHGRGLVHRDLKPGNILIAVDGPRVIDFGISRALASTVLTTALTTMGTPAYMSPEQAEGREIGPPSDVFSLGSVIAFAATGIAPFDGDTLFSVVYRVVRAEPDLSRLPPALHRLVAGCIAKDPASRPSPAQLMDAVFAAARRSFLRRYPGSSGRIQCRRWWRDTAVPWSTRLPLPGRFPATCAARPPLAATGRTSRIPSTRLFPGRSQFRRQDPVPERSRPAVAAAGYS